MSTLVINRLAPSENGNPRLVRFQAAKGRQELRVNFLACSKSMQTKLTLWFASCVGSHRYTVLMRWCWSDDPEDRPLFSTVLEQITQLQGRMHPKSALYESEM
jgi:hypothetical protein